MCNQNSESMPDPKAAYIEATNSASSPASESEPAYRRRMGFDGMPRYMPNVNTGGTSSSGQSGKGIDALQDHKIYPQQLSVRQQLEQRLKNTLEEARLLHDAINLLTPEVEQSLAARAALRRVGIS